MASEEAGAPGASGYVVLREVEAGRWVVIGDVDRRRGLTARNSRMQAVKDCIGREPADGEVYAALPRSEWRVARQFLVTPRLYATGTFSVTVDQLRSLRGLVCQDRLSSSSCPSIRPAA